VAFITQYELSLLQSVLRQFDEFKPPLMRTTGVSTVALMIQEMAAACSGSRFP